MNVSPYYGQPHIPPTIFARMDEIKAKHKMNDIIISVASDMTGNVYASIQGRPLIQYAFTDLNTLYATLDHIDDTAQI